MRRPMRKLMLFEDYIEAPDYKINATFKELAGEIKKWFSPEGSFGSQGCKIIGGAEDGEANAGGDDGITISNINPMEKFLMFKFTEKEFQDKNTGQVEQFYYRVNFIIRLDQMKNEANESPQQDLLGDLGETGAPPAQQAPPAQGDPTGGGGGEAAPAETPKNNLSIDKILLKIEKYNTQDKLIKELVEEISATDAMKDDFISGKISKLEDSEKTPDLKDNITQTQ